MKHFLVATLTTLLAAIAGAMSCGAGLGEIFWLITVVALLAPIFVTRGSTVLPALGVTAGVAVASLLPLFRDTIDGAQLVQLLLLLATFAFVLAAVTRLLIAIRIEPTLASGLVIVLALAWLSWPIWLSPHLTDSLTETLTPLHPLLAINGVVPQHGYWHQSRLMYNLTALGQDVRFELPRSVLPASLFHAVIAAAVLIPLVVSRRTSRAAPAATASAP